MTTATTASTLLQTYSKYVLSKLNIQQFDEVSTFTSFRTVSTCREVINSVAVLTTPTTGTEFLSGSKGSTVSLGIRADVSIARIGLVQSVISSLPAQLSSYLHSNPISLSLLDDTVCGPAGCAFTVVLATVDDFQYSNGSANTSTFTTTCAAGDRNTYVHHCAGGLPANVTCDGSPLHSVVTQCPYKITQPSCSRLSAATGTSTNDVCQVTAYDSASTTCVCKVAASLFSDSRRLGHVVPTSAPVPVYLQLGTAAVTTIIIAKSGRYMVPTKHPTSPPSSSPVVFKHSHLSTEAIIVVVVTLVFSCCMLVILFICYARVMRRQGKQLFALRSIRAARVLDEASAYHQDNGFAFSVENTMHSPAKKKRTSLSKVVPVRKSVDLGEIDLDMHEEWERGNRDCIPMQDNDDARSMENGGQDTLAGLHIRNKLSVSVDLNAIHCSSLLCSALLFSSFSLVLLFLRLYWPFCYPLHLHLIRLNRI